MGSTCKTSKVDTVNIYQRRVLILDYAFLKYNFPNQIKFLLNLIMH